MAINLTITVVTPTNAVTLLQLNQAGISESIARLEATVPEITSMKLELAPGPSGDYNWDVATDSPTKKVNQVVTFAMPPSNSLISGTIQGTWNVEDNVAVTDVLTRLINVHQVSLFTKWQYSKTIV